MNHLWFVSVDTVRLRWILRGARARVASHACFSAASAAGVRLVHARVLPFGMRSIVETSDRSRVRGFVRTFVAHSVTPAGPPAAWRSGFRVTSISRDKVTACRRFIESGAGIRIGDDDMGRIASKKARSNQTARSLPAVLRIADQANDAALGGDEVAARTRRYVADHDAPSDDRAAFARMCLVVFAQGLSLAVVDRQRAALAAAFNGFDPARVARFNDARIRRLVKDAPIRNVAKIRACVENAKRWMKAARQHGTYLGRIAAAAASDDASSGWPALATLLEADFVRIGDTAARQTLKRWGFFTAFANPSAQRLLARLGYVEREAPTQRVQSLIGSLAQSTSRDVYAVEASLALFAGEGPCRLKPHCDQCVLLERCPTGTAAGA